MHRFWGVRLGEDLGKRLRERKVKALWIQGWQVLAYWQAVWQAEKTGVPVWLRGESNDLAPKPFWKKISNDLLLRSLFRKIHSFLYIGKANRRLYENYGVPPEQLHAAPYAVDNERFARQAGDLLPKRSLIRREWKIPEDAFCVLFAGKFIPKKRPLDLVRTLSNGRFRSSIPPVHLLFAGSGEWGGRLREACRVVFDAEKMGKGGEGPQASFVGFLNQTEISKAYVAADCLVLPSDSRETWGLVVNEAMASGIPCIVSDACGCNEDLIKPLNSKLSYRAGDLNDLAGSLSFLISRPFPREVPKKAVAEFSIGRCINTVRKLYQESEQ